MEYLEYESKKYATNLKYILESQSITMSDAIKLDKKISVVYVISDCNNDIVYVGETYNFSARMKSHVYDDKGLAKKNKLRCDDVLNYNVKYYTINEYRERLFFECYVISITTPKYNDVTR